MNSLRQQASQGLKKGDCFSYSRIFTKQEALLFGDLTKDYNPVHYDKGWIENKGFKDLICHGLLVGSMICELGGQVGWLATGMNFKFINPVYFGDQITCSVTILEVQPNGRAKAEAVFTNQDGLQVAYVELSGRLPVEKEKCYLEQMIQSGDPTNKLSDKNYAQ
ncbi:MAG: MaoC family dehydratase [Pseudomonadota bacterium]